MDIFLANERAFHFVPQTTVEVAIDRLEQKKSQLVAGTMGALISHPKPEDIQLISVENRLEAFWELTVSLRTLWAGPAGQRRSKGQHQFLPEWCGALPGRVQP